MKKCLKELSKDVIKYLLFCLKSDDRCSMSGHTARNCTQDGDLPTCYNCNKIGHIIKAGL